MLFQRITNLAVMVYTFCVIVLFLVSNAQSFVGHSNFLRIARSIHETRSFYPSLEIYAAQSSDANKAGRKLTPAQKAIKKSIGTDLNEFDKLKQAAYGAADGIQNLVKKKDEVPESFVVDGYSDRRKQVPQKDKSLKPLKGPSSTKSNVFESVKGAVYGTADVASTIGNIVAGSDKKITLPKEKVPVKKVLSQEMIESIPDLKSNNPIKRLAAEVKLKNLELSEGARMKQKEIEDNIDKVKNAIYTAGDVINETVGIAKAFPGKVTKFVGETKEFIESVPSTLQKTVDEISAIPSKIEQKATEVRTTVETTVDTTKKIIDDVKALPSRVQESVENTKKSIDNTVKTVEEVKTNTKVLFGLEKPKPKPPKTPPPKAPTFGDIAFKVFGTVASTLGKGVLWAGKSAVDLSVVAAKKGIESAKESASKQQQASAVSLPTPPKPVASTKATIDKAVAKEAEKIVQPLPKEEEARRNDVIDTDDLERQVAEALKLAEEALDASPASTDKVEPEKEVAKPVAAEKIVQAKVEATSKKSKNTKSKKKSTN